MLSCQTAHRPTSYIRHPPGCQTKCRVYGPVIFQNYRFDLTVCSHAVSAAPSAPSPPLPPNQRGATRASMKPSIASRAEPVPAFKSLAMIENAATFPSFNTA